MAVRIPIYMLHQVAPNTDPAYEPYLYMTPDVLRKQIRTLRTRGISFISLRNAWAQIKQGTQPCAAVLTFDDLYGAFADYALPVLKEQGAAATVFVIGDSLRGGTPANLSPALTHPPTPGMLRELVESGVEIGSHGMTHRVMTELSDAELRTELEDSRKIIEDAIGKPVTSLCYPRGHVSPRVEAAVRDAGYTCACSTLRGNVHEATEQYRLKRVRLHNDRRGLRLWYTTTGLYDWWNAKRYERERARYAAEDVSSE